MALPLHSSHTENVRTGAESAFPFHSLPMYLLNYLNLLNELRRNQIVQIECFVPFFLSEQFTFNNNNLMQGLA